MTHKAPSDADWARIQSLLPPRPGPYALDRRYHNAVLDVAKTGLAIVGDILDRHGDHLTLEADALTGTTFRVYLREA